MPLLRWPVSAALHLSATAADMTVFTSKGSASRSPVGLRTKCLSVRRAQSLQASLAKMSGSKRSSRRLQHVRSYNLQATKLFIVTSATKGGGYHPLRFSVRFKILYRVIQ